MTLPFRYLTEDDVQRLLVMPTALVAVEAAFAALARGEAVNVPRFRAAAPGIVLHSMSATAAYLGLVGWKSYTTSKQGTVFHVGVYEQSTGRMLALIEANRLGQLRTGAATGVAAKYLARPDADSVGIFGSGWQAETQLEAIANVRSLRRAVVYSRNAERRAAFAARMANRLQVEVTAATEPRAAVDEQPIVVTATTSRTPVFDGEWLAPGALVCAVGSNWLEKSEVDLTTFRRAARVICDSRDACRAEAGDFVPALQAGLLTWERTEELADIVAQKTAARENEHDILLFKSVGLAIEDIAVADRLLR